MSCPSIQQSSAIKSIFIYPDPPKSDPQRISTEHVDAQNRMLVEKAVSYHHRVIRSKTLGLHLGFLIKRSINSQHPLIWRLET